MIPRPTPDFEKQKKWAFKFGPVVYIGVLLELWCFDTFFSLIPTSAASDFVSLIYGLYTLHKAT